MISWMIASPMLSVAMFIVLVAEKVEPGGSSFWPPLLGALLGGAVSLVTTLLVERQRTARETEQHKRKLLADARLASRVIGFELANLESVFRVALQQTPFRWPPAPGYSLSVEAWAKYGASLGAVVSDDVWEIVALPYSSFGFANLLGPVNAATAQTMLDQTTAAVKALNAWASAARLDDAAI